MTVADNLGARLQPSDTQPLTTPTPAPPYKGEGDSLATLFEQVTGVGDWLGGLREYPPCGEGQGWGGAEVGVSKAATTGVATFL